MFGALKRGRFRSLASLILVVNVVGNFNRKEHLRHRAVSLRQHGFLVSYTVPKLVRFLRHSISIIQTEHSMLRAVGSSDEDDL